MVRWNGGKWFLFCSSINNNFSQEKPLDPTFELRIRVSIAKRKIFTKASVTHILHTHTRPKLFFSSFTSMTWHLSAYIWHEMCIAHILPKSISWTKWKRNHFEHNAMHSQMFTYPFWIVNAIAFQMRDMLFELYVNPDY